MVISLAKGAVLSGSGSVQSGFNGTPQIATLGTPQLGNPTLLVVGVEVSAATTITVFVSYDGTTWLAASVLGTATAASVVFGGAGAQAVQIVPAPFVKVVTSGAATVSAWAYAA